MQKFADQRRFVPRLGARSLVLCLWGVCVLVTAQPAFPPTGPDILQSPTVTMIDPEFNTDKHMFAWVDMVSGSIWQASYDYATGNFIPASGQGTLIEASVSTGGSWGGLGFTINGPEWALGSPTDYIVYTRTNAPGSPTAANSLIGLAYQNSNGAWVTASLATPQRNGPYGSVWRGSSAKISYQDAKGTHYVRTLTNTASEVALPGLTNSGLTPAARFADTGNIVVYQVSYNGIPQSVAYNIDTGVLTQLTFDAGSKDQSWMWSAPEFNGALALMTTVNKTTVSLYRPVVAGSGATTYQPYASAVAPNGGSWFSVEPFAYQGHSYAIMQLTPKGSTIPGSIWLAGFDPANPILRQLTPNTVSTDARADAEFIPLATGVRWSSTASSTRQSARLRARRPGCARRVCSAFSALTQDCRRRIDATPPARARASQGLSDAGNRDERKQASSQRAESLGAAWPRLVAL